MDELDRTLNNQALMALGLYSFLDNVLSRIPNSDNSSPLDLTTSGPTYSSISGDNSGVGAAGTPSGGSGNQEPWIVRRQRFQAPTNTDENQTDEFPSMLATGAESLDVDDLTMSSESSEEKEPVEAGGYSDDLFLYLSDKEKEEFTCSIW